MEQVETMYDVSNKLMQAKEMLKMGFASKNEIIDSLYLIDDAINDLQDICEKENVCPFCGGDIEEIEVREDCGIYVQRKCSKCGEEF